MCLFNNYVFKNNILFRHTVYFDSLAANLKSIYYNSWYLPMIFFEFTLNKSAFSKQICLAHNTLLSKMLMR